MIRPVMRSFAAGALLAPLLSCNGKAPSTTTQPTSTPSACSFAIAPATASFAPTGGSQVVTVSATPSGCAPAGWTATTTAGLTLSPTSGSGNGSVTVAAPANSGTTPQSLTATIAGQPFTATVAGIACTYTFAANAPDLGVDTWTVPSDASERGVTVSVSPNDGSCAPWKAAATADWISLKPSSGTTSATVRIDYTANTAMTARSGSVSFSRPDCSGPACGVTVNVNQSGAPAIPPPATFTLNLTLKRTAGGGVVVFSTAPTNHFSCQIDFSATTVTCPAAAFPNGSTVQLRALAISETFLETVSSSGCDAVTGTWSTGTWTCVVNMNADRSVVITTIPPSSSAYR